MLTRLLAILLVPFFVVGNSLAHCHDTAAHVSPSQGRAHFHLGNDSHHEHHRHQPHGHAHVHSHVHSHGHSHGRHGCDHDRRQRHAHRPDDAQPASTTPIDHDSDAIYVSAVNFWFSVSEHGPLEFGACAVVACFDDYMPAIQPPFRRNLLRHSLGSGPPLYLLHAVLRL